MMKKENELDIIIEQVDHQWAAIGIKLLVKAALKSASNNDKVIKTLKLEHKYKEVVFKMIIPNY